MIYGVVVAWQQKKFAADGKTVLQQHFGNQIAKVPGTHLYSYIAITALVVNLIVAVVLTLVFRAVKVADGVDETQAADYTADEGDSDLPNLIEAEPALAEM